MNNEFRNFYHRHNRQNPLISDQQIKEATMSQEEVEEFKKHSRPKLFKIFDRITEKFYIFEYYLGQGRVILVNFYETR